MNILSLFDGCSIARLALKNLDIKCNYYSSEIDKYCIQVSRYNWSDIIELGNIYNYDTWKLSKIDLLIGGSPCQNLSKAGNRHGLSGSKSSLFYKYISILDIFKPKYFLFENVKCNKKDVDLISNYLGRPILINSSLVSAQDRKRYYWSNFKFTQPQDLNIKLNSILEKYYDIKYYYSDVAKNYILKKSNNYSYASYEHKNKSSTVLSSWFRGQPNNVLFLNNGKIRRFTPIETERLQTIPDNYTSVVSNTQRYKMIGNAFTTKVIEHIISHIV